LKAIANGLLEYIIDPDPEYDDLEPIIARVVQIIINAQRIEK